MFEAYETKAMEMTAAALAAEHVAKTTRAVADIQKGVSALHALGEMHQRAAVAATDACARARHADANKAIAAQIRDLRNLRRG